MRFAALVSGGLDSAVMVAFSLRHGVEVYAITVDYGQRHAYELIRAEEIADTCYAKVRATVNIGEFIPSTLTSGAELATRTLEEIRADRRLSPAYVPGRNTILLSLAAAYAEAHGLDAILIGATADDAAGFPDCRSEFFDAFSATCGRRVIAPFVWNTKAAVVAVGIDLGVDFSKTTSCYQPEQGFACGRCDACLVRLDAFAANGIEDPIGYRWKP